MEQSVVEEKICPETDPNEGGSTLDFIFSQCDREGIGWVSASQLIMFLTQLVDGTESGKDLVDGLRLVLDPNGEDSKITSEQFRKYVEEWEAQLPYERGADNIEIIPNSNGTAGNEPFNENNEKNWKMPLGQSSLSSDSDEVKDQLINSNNELILQKKWLEEQNSELMAMLKNSEDSNTALQINFDLLKKENEELKTSIDGMKVLRDENEELKELLNSWEEKCSNLKTELEKVEQKTTNLQDMLEELESEKSVLKNELESCLKKESEYVNAIEFQYTQIESLSKNEKDLLEKVKSEEVRCQELQSSVESLLEAIKNHEEEREEMEEKMARAEEKYWTTTSMNNTPQNSNLKLSPRYVAGLCSDEEVRDECKTLYKDLFSESPSIPPEEQPMSIESELKKQVESSDSELDKSMPEAKLLRESFNKYLEDLKDFDCCADAMVQVQHTGRGCLSEMTVKDVEEEGDEENRVRGGDDAWMQFHADEGSEAPSCACSHEAGHPSPERLRRLQVVREVAALRSQILRSQAVLAALAQSSDLLGVPEAASAARGVSDYGDAYDVGSVGSAATQHGHQPRSMESVVPSHPFGGGRASAGAFGAAGEIAEEGEVTVDGSRGGGRRQLTKSCPALTSQVSIATQVDVEDLLTPSSSRAAVEVDGVGRRGEKRGSEAQSSPKRARSSSFLAAIEGGTLSEEEEEELEARLPPPSPPPEEQTRICVVTGTQTVEEESEETESTGGNSEPPPEIVHATPVFEPRVDSLDLDEYRSVRKLSVLPEENEEALAGGVMSDGGAPPTPSSTSTSSPQRSSLRRSRASPAPPPYRPPPNPYRPHSRSFESYLDPEQGLRRREEAAGGGRQGVPRQCSDPTPSATASTHHLQTPTAKPHDGTDTPPSGEDTSRSPLRHSSTTRPLELFGGGKAVRFDGASEPMASGDHRRKPLTFAHRRLLPPPTSTSPLAEEDEIVMTPNSPGGESGDQVQRMEHDQEGAGAEPEGEDEEAVAREAGRRLRTRRRSTPGSPAAAIKRSAAVDYGEGVEDSGNSSAAVEAEVMNHPVAVPFPSLTDPALCKMGLLAGPGAQEVPRPSDLLSEQDIENKFTSLSLAFKTDRITLISRLELQQRQRDLAEKNVLCEIKQLKSTLNCLNHLCTDMETTELLGKIRHQVDVLQQSAQRVSSHAEMYGAVQQESRVSAAIEVMLLHVENLKRLHEKDHGELEDTKRILLENNIVLEGGAEAIDESRPSQRTARYRSLQSLVGANKIGSRRRASIAAIPRNPGRMEAFITSSPMDVGGMGRVSIAGSLITSTASAASTIIDTDNERRRESIASQILNYGNCSPLETPEKTGWSVTPPGEEDDELQMGDDVSEAGTSSWDCLGSSAVEAEDGCAHNSTPMSSEDSTSRCGRRSFGSGEMLVLRRDGLAARVAEGPVIKDRWAIPPAFPVVHPPLSIKVTSYSTVLREWLGRWIKTPWLGQRRNSALDQEKGLTLLHARHCLTCILLVVAVISLGATIVSTDAHVDRWNQLADYHYEFRKIIRPYLQLRHHTRPPV